MTNLIIYSLFFLVIFTLFFKVSKSFVTQFYIRKQIKKGIKENKSYIKIMNGDKNRLYDVYQRIYDQVVYSPNKLLSLNKRKFYIRVNRELNRMIENPITRIFSKLLITVRGITTIVLLLASLIAGSIVLDEYKTSSLKLPTVNPDFDFSVSTDIGRDLKQLFSETKLEKFNFASIDNNDIDPVYSQVDSPSEVTNAEQLGQAMASHMAEFEDTFTIYYEGDTRNFESELDAAYDWLDQNQPYLGAIRGESYSRYIDYGSHIELQMTMNYDLTAEENALVQGKVKKIVSNIDPNLSDAEKVQFVNDYLVTHTKYNDSSEVNPHTPYAILFYGEGVCEGYALAAYLMLDELGIENKYVVGDAGGPHAWNLVKVDGNWYHLDTTWNDPIPDQGKRISYNYFLISDDTISDDHSWDTSNYPTTSIEDYL